MKITAKILVPLSMLVMLSQLIFIGAIKYGSVSNLNLSAIALAFISYTFFLATISGLFFSNYFSFYRKQILTKRANVSFNPVFEFSSMISVQLFIFCVSNVTVLVFIGSFEKVFWNIENSVNKQEFLSLLSVSNIVIMISILGLSPFASKVDGRSLT